MNKNSILRPLLPALLAIMVTVPALAVTDNEMEQARTIAAQAYLRYANNGSGYLDEVKATNLADLQKELKAKEKENIKAFLAIPVPKDYAQWDKAKLAEYWSVTVLNNPGLIAQGKGAKSRIRSRINAMTVSDPAAQPAAPTAPDAAETPAPEQPAAGLSDSVPQEILSQEQDILADQKAIEADSQNPSLESTSNHTWIYVVILVILIAVVIWLVIYAAKVMKHQRPADGDSNDPEGLEEMRERAKRAIAQYKDKLQDLNEQLQASDNRLAEAQEEARRYKEDNRRLNERIADLQAKLRAAATTQASPAPRQQPQPRPQARPNPEKKTDDILHVIYLGRANSRGIFVRADRNYSNGNTVYKLDTEDGLTGTFEYVDNPSMNRTVLERPKEMLSGGCSADDIEDTLGATEIVTESRGTAIFENGYWKVLRKSRIRFK